MAKKTAVVLFNLGGPDNQESVKPFLFNLFNDPAIIGAPNPIRWLLAKFISSKREKTAQEIYSHMGGGSPILQQTIDQANALEKELGKNHKVFICMRYWNPRAKEVIKQVKEYVPDEIILLPLYPQFSTTTTGSSVKEFKEYIQKEGIDKDVKTICCYYKSSFYLRAQAAFLREYFEKAKLEGRPRVLFSAHGLPKKIIDKGDPYQDQVEKCAQSIVSMMNIENLDWQVCYQSKVGPLEWIGPSTEDEIVRAAKEPGISLIIVPIAFVSEHSETLVELDIEYKELAEEKGLKNYFRVPTLGTNPLFIKALSQSCLSFEEEGRDIKPFGNEVCEDKFGRCPCKNN